MPLTMDAESNMATLYSNENYLAHRKPTPTQPTPYP